ncbi:MULTISPECIES: DUF397 domain-containing protein [Thermomonospora]|uniref:DUF397 domain-containing protein n=1 Tax=Thermomonospora curvata (strain ATCC 19995 / DSM 43183 / JCM 3096 / KCTC 9072 / NBRC 15933 / NCIMB 10081 / Henssen B9) TaxID=471852 RepID=D1AF71_THECD|nr:MULTISPECIES: DUF397 domain-containing protein [Thermomonospora]ACY99615.1 protein of unknown function DUF397 [Thermomonospora curvata DSM 43183]PKK12642.1 MAG: DUF397 domain-containing protein [Thermomonospora sp. CIF 1]
MTNKIVWRKSSRSGTQEGNCVEVAALPEGIGLRDSKNPAAGHLAVSRRHFTALVRKIKNS